MILRHIRLEAFRCFAAPVEIGPLDERISVIHGPNGTGKTTLLMALERALFDRPESGDADIKALVPWERDLAPRTTLEFAEGADDYRLEKVFGARGLARLARRVGAESGAGGRWEPWKEGIAAVDWVREQLGGRAPGRGATRPEHRGLAQLLFVPQGNLPLPEKLGEGAAERLRSVVGAIAVSPATRAVEEQLKKEYDERYTAGGKARRGSRAQVAADDLTTAEAALTLARRHWQELDDLRDDQQKIGEEVAALLAKKRQLAEDKERLGPLARRFKELCAKRDQARRDEAEANADYGRIVERIDGIKERRRRVAELDGKEAVQRASTAQIEARLEEARQKASEATAARQVHEAAGGAVREARRVAEAAAHLARARAEIDDLEPRQAGHREAQEEIEKLTEELERSGAPSGTEIKKLRDALAEERSAREAVEAQKLRLRLSALVAISVEAEEGSVALGPGEERVWSGEGQLRLRLPGIATLEVSGPVAEVGGARERLLATGKTVEKLVAALGSRVPEELEVRRAHHKELESRRKVAETRRDGKLRKGETLESLDKKLAAAAARRDRILADHPAWSSAPPDADALESGAREEEGAHEVALARLRADEESRQRAQGEAQRAADEASRVLGRARADLEGARGELRAAISDGLSDEERDRQRLEVSKRLLLAADAVKYAEANLEELPGNPETELDRVQRQLGNLLEDLPRRQQELGRREQALKDAAERAPYAALATLEEKGEVLRAELDHLRLEADSIALLKTLFEEERARATAELLGPVIDRVMPRMKKLAGPRYVGLTLDDQFRPSGVRLRELERDVDPDQLSFGTRDQLSLLVRLALGEIVAQGTRLTAVLDDPLAHADAARLRRFISLLEDASQTLQLVILTCRPEDYRGLTVGSFIDLDEASRARATDLRIGTGG